MFLLCLQVRFLLAGANKRDALALHAGEWSNQRPGYAHVMSSQQSFAQQQGYSCHLALKRVFPPLQVSFQLNQMLVLCFCLMQLLCDSLQGLPICGPVQCR